MSYLHDKYVVVPSTNTMFMHLSNYIGFLIKEFTINNSLGNSTYTPREITEKRKYLTIILLFCVLLEYQQKWMNSVLLHSTG